MRWCSCYKVWDTRSPAAPVRRIFGPFIGGDALDLDTQKQEVLAGSYRQTDSLEVMFVFDTTLLM